MPVLFNSKMIIPGPLVDIRREIVRNEAGKKIRQYYVIQAKGKLSAYKGSPNSSGQFWTGSYNPGPPDENIGDTSRLAALRSKISALNDLFCQQGMWFEIQPFDGTASIKFQPIVKNISFAQGLWYEVVDYTIDMEAATIFLGNNEACGLNTDILPEESWSIEVADQIGRTYRLTHNLSSQQKDLYDATGQIPDGNAGWQRAKAIVLPHLGLTDPTQMYAPGVINLTNWQAYNYFKAEQVDEGAGRFGVTETWLVYDATQGTGKQMPPALDDFTVNTRTSDDGISSVTIDGTITGLEIRDNISGVLSSTRWDNAQAYYNQYISPNVFSRVSSYSGLLLNPMQLVFNIGRNPVQGTISYSAEFSNRKSPLIPGAIRENISLQQGGGTDVFASIPVLGRPWGPVLQGLSTITERSMSINIDAQLQSATMLNPVQNAPNTDGLILSLAPVASQVFLQRDESSWIPEAGKYSRQVTFVYQ